MNWGVFVVTSSPHKPRYKNLHSYNYNQFCDSDTVFRPHRHPKFNKKKIKQFKKIS